MSLKDPNLQALLDARIAKMRAKGFVPMDEAATLAETSKSNIYHWSRSVADGGTGELRRVKLGSGKYSLFVSLEDLRKKMVVFDVDAAVAAAAPASAPKPLKRQRRGARKRAA